MCSIAQHPLLTTDKHLIFFFVQLLGGVCVLFLPSLQNLNPTGSGCLAYLSISTPVLLPRQKLRSGDQVTEKTPVKKRRNGESKENARVIPWTSYIRPVNFLYLILIDRPGLLALTTEILRLTTQSEQQPLSDVLNMLDLKRGD
jgi:hypothetical protein